MHALRQWPITEILLWEYCIYIPLNESSSLSHENEREWAVIWRRIGYHWYLDRPENMYFWRISYNTYPKNRYIVASIIWTAWKRYIYINNCNMSNVLHAFSLRKWSAKLSRNKDQRLHRTCLNQRYVVRSLYLSLGLIISEDWNDMSLNDVQYTQRERELWTNTTSMMARAALLWSGGHWWLAICVYSGGWSSSATHRLQIQSSSYTNTRGLLEGGINSEM